ncbi:hypothetical protein D3C87_1720900 [compost metagenome]
MPVEVYLGEEAGSIADQATAVEGIVAVVDVGDQRVGETIGQLLVAGLGAPGQAIGEVGVPFDLQVFAGLEAQGMGLTSQPTGQHGQGQASGGTQGLLGDYCFYHVVLLPEPGIARSVCVGV